MVNDMMPASVEEGHAAKTKKIGNIDPETAAGLQECFLILSLLFRYPESELYQRLEEYAPDFEPFFQEYAGQGLELFPLEDLQAEYIRLFVNNQGYVPVVPYCSYYLDQGKLLGGKTLENIRKIYAGTGFVLEQDQGELEDHLGVLLEFCARILTDFSGNVALDPDQSSARVRTLSEIVSRYLLPVSTEISELIKDHARFDVYRVAGETLKNFLQDLDHHVAG
ncbi:MAG: molecular chaperone TorD family protein [Desulfohalobiaceae bacterium]|nr:molecular chaperone TorD family protein [Desulfohalobiaceae bacterium]